MIGSVKKLAILLSRDHFRQDFTAFLYPFREFSHNSNFEAMDLTNPSMESWGQV